MNNFIGYSGPLYMFITPEEMYGELGKLKSSHINYKEADIYFLSKMKKVKFDKSFKKVTKDASVEIKVMVFNKDGSYKEQKGEIEIVDFFYSFPHIKKDFRSKDEFLFNILYSLYIPQKFIWKKILKIAKGFFIKGLLSEEVLFKLLKYIYSTEVKVEFFSDYTISIDEPISKILTDEEGLRVQQELFPDRHEEILNLNNEAFDKESLEKVDYAKLDEYNSESIILSIDQIVNKFDIDVGEQEILYIGQTQREAFERLLPHEKLQELTSKFLRNDNEAIVVHLFGFQVFSNLISYHKLKSDDKLTALEAELIKYFRPEMNDKFKNGNRNSWKHIKNMKKLGVKEIMIELDIDGQYCRFTTKKVKKENPNQHIIRIKL